MESFECEITLVPDSTLWGAERQCCFVFICNVIHTGFAGGPLPCALLVIPLASLGLISWNCTLGCATVIPLALWKLGLEQVTKTIRIANTGWRIRYVSRIHFFSEAKLGNG